MNVEDFLDINMLLKIILVVNCALHNLYKFYSKQMHVFEKNMLKHLQRKVKNKNNWKYRMSTKN